MKTLQQQLEEAEAMLTSVRRQLEANEDVSKPNLGDTYWPIDSYGNIIQSVWRNDYFDNKRISIGNVYRTKEEAEKEVARLKVMKKLKDLAGGFVPDWDNINERKWYLYYAYEDKVFSVSNVLYSAVPMQIYFPTKEAAQHAIDVLGDELYVLL